MLNYQRVHMEDVFEIAMFDSVRGGFKKTCPVKFREKNAACGRYLGVCREHVIYCVIYGDPKYY